MALSLTEYGAKALLDYLFRELDESPWTGEGKVGLLVSEPPDDWTVSHIEEFDISDEFEPSMIDVTRGDWQEAVSVDDAGAIQAGPPSLKFTSLGTQTVYGYVFTDGQVDVLWFDRFETPIDCEIGGLVQVIPEFTLRNTPKCEEPEE